MAETVYRTEASIDTLTRKVEEHQRELRAAIWRVDRLADDAAEEQRKARDRDRQLAELQQELGLRPFAGVSPPTYTVLAAAPVAPPTTLALDGEGTATNTVALDREAVRKEVKDVLAEDAQDAWAAWGSRSEKRYAELVDFLWKLEAELRRHKADGAHLRKDLCLLEGRLALQAVTSSVFCLKSMSLSDHLKEHSLKVLIKKEERMKKALAEEHRAKPLAALAAPEPGAAAQAGMVQSNERGSLTLTEGEQDVGSSDGQEQGEAPEAAAAQRPRPAARHPAAAPAVAVAARPPQPAVVVPCQEGAAAAAALSRRSWSAPKGLLGMMGSRPRLEL